ncbi:MAG TPA: hypothetical protein VE985_06590 [Gaiellaceae bacterium]|nr:hypothetical protein [Gaiellaceae bacterium]
MTSEAALAVELDHSTAKGAVGYPVPMVGAGHWADPAGSISRAEVIVRGRRVEERMRLRGVGRFGPAAGRRFRVRLSDDGAGAVDMPAPTVG